MKILSTLFEKTELFYYLIIGTLATVIDWAVFAIAVNKFSLHYQFALILGYVCGGIMHYIANKLVTFRCRSKEIASQLSLYTIVGAASLGLNMAVLAILVQNLAWNKVGLRIATTIIMILPNYLLHKHISFSKRIFAQPK